MSAEPHPDPRRWITLVILVASVFLVSLDNSVLNVAVPTILRDFDTNLAHLQWVITGYALTFASLLIVGGRLADLYGNRRIFIIGVSLFGAGSLIAALSPSVGVLIVGEAVIEGLGAALMMPSSIAILSNTFTGHERAVAFSVWGATSGIAASFGPVVGGLLTTHASWRWAFGINVIVAPIAVVGALLLISKHTDVRRRLPIDGAGVGLIASGVFLLVFGLSQGETYGWWSLRAPLAILGVDVWPTSMPVSVVPAAFVLAVALLSAFVRVELTKGRLDGAPLFDFTQMRRRGFRYGLPICGLLVAGQLGLLFVLPIFLQQGLRFSAETTGYWMLPFGVFVVVGSQLGARGSRRIGVTRVVQIGLAAEAVGLVLVALVVAPDLRFAELIPGTVLFGSGLGIASSQVTNVILTGVEPDKTGVASGAISTIRQVGSALGIAVIGSILTAQAVSSAGDQVAASSQLSPAVKDAALERIRELGTNFVPPDGLGARDLAELRAALVDGVAHGTHIAILFATVVVGVGALLSLRLPAIEASRREPAARPAGSGH